MGPRAGLAEPGDGKGNMAMAGDEEVTWGNVRPTGGKARWRRC